ncbi:Hypothetical predicted protein [Xyrichtys novacula]|uniref:Uncharacterized protein n=1 Tax=Xyrichtys novacula TaxID=13765 RepID=A0AAV1EMX0_XYRNO|nr:Hypothetical predicted protein [Xyrichtys novacula]
MSAVKVGRASGRVIESEECGFREEDQRRWRKDDRKDCYIIIGGTSYSGVDFDANQDKYRRVTRRPADQHLQLQKLRKEPSPEPPVEPEDPEEQRKT